MITSADLYDAIDPPLFFEVKTRPPKEWARLAKDFSDGGNEDEGLARQIIALVFLTISEEDGEVYEIDTVEKVRELQDAVGDGDDETGREFVLNMAQSFGNHHYYFLEQRLGASLKPSKPLNGKG